MMSLTKNERFTEIKPSSPTIPKCQYFGVCLGCQSQDIDYGTQLKAKTDAVVGVMADSGVAKHGLVTDCLPSPNEYGYRNCLDLAITQDDNGKVRVGIHSAHAHYADILPVEACALLPVRVAGLPKSIGGALGYLFGANRDLPVDRVRIRVSKHRSNLDISLWTGPMAFPRHMVAKTLASATKASSITRVIFSESSSAQKVAGVEHLAGQNSWVERIGGVSFFVTSVSPFPHNTAVAEIMLEKAKEITNISRNDRLLELNPGAIAFSIPMSFSAGESIVVESRRFALTDIARSAEAAGAPLEIVPGDIEHSLEPAGDFDVVIAHLPDRDRALSPQAWARIMGTRPRLLLYRTNQLSFLSKDIGLITRSGYILEKVMPFDVSPHTSNLEVLALFQRM
ncbi:MAG: hypothetical protein KGZ89_06080 [Actinobacteria bacterium]|nr:hypothetical protein [Actinomycetota bacterium]